MNRFFGLWGWANFGSRLLHTCGTVKSSIGIFLSKNIKRMRSKALGSNNLFVNFTSESRGIYDVSHVYANEKIPARHEN
jgi:hypothetical protein